jgi:hypothetical protein
MIDRCFNLRVKFEDLLVKNVDRSQKRVTEFTVPGASNRFSFLCSHLDEVSATPNQLPKPTFRGFWRLLVCWMDRCQKRAIRPALVAKDLRPRKFALTKRTNLHRIDNANDMAVFLVDGNKRVQSRFDAIDDSLQFRSAKAG